MRHLMRLFEKHLEKFSEVEQQGMLKRARALAQLEKNQELSARIATHPAELRENVRKARKKSLLR